MRRGIVLALGVALALALVASPAQAKVKKVKVETEVTIDYFGPDFFGEVIASKPKCERNRTVVVSYLGPGGSSAPATYAPTKSAADGSWRLTVGDAGGFFQATAKKRKFKKRRNGEIKKVIVCKRGASPVTPVV